MDRTKLGDHAYESMEKVNSELLGMMYGALVTQLLKDYQDVVVVNKELETMGYNIGVRLIDEFLAKSNLDTCRSWRDTAEVIAKVGFKLFLGITAEVTKWDDEHKQFTLTFRGNPLHDCVEVPPDCVDLDYSNILCGVIRGALQMVNMIVECEYVQSELRGDDVSEIQVRLKEVMQESYNPDDD